MKWIEILRKDKYALLQSESDTQYAVVSGYDPTQPEDQQWENGWYITYFNNKNAKPKSLMYALEHFLTRTESKYIPRCRIDEIATLFKDKIIDECGNEAMTFFDYDCGMTDEEKSFLGISNKIPIEFTIKTSYSTENYYTEILPGVSIETQIREVLANLSFCDDYRIFSFHEVSKEYVNERRMLIKEYEMRYGYIEDDFICKEYVALDVLKSTIKAYKNAE